MANYLLLDADALNNAWKAGGTALLDRYMDHVRGQGFTPIASDVVQLEIDLGPLKAELSSWFNSQQIETIATSEAIKFRAYRDALDAGLDTSFYNPKDGGDRSIVELASGLSGNGHGIGILSEDRYFDSSQLLRGTSVSPEMRVTNADIVRGMRDSGFVSTQEFESIKNSFRSNVNSYIPGGGAYSSRLDTFDVVSGTGSVRGVPALTNVLNTLKTGASSVLVLGASAALLSVIVSNNAEATGEGTPRF